MKRHFSVIDSFLKFIIVYLLTFLRIPIFERKFPCKTNFFHAEDGELNDKIGFKIHMA